MARFLENWQQLTSDPWVLEVVSRGFTFQFVKPPPLSLDPVVTPLVGTHREHLVDAVDTLLAKGALQRVLDYRTSPGFYSPYFLSQNKDGSLRPILNLKEFNQYMVKEKFRMETLHSILLTLQQNDWLVSVDLKDAYLHVPIHADYHKYLRFAYRDALGNLQVFQWVVLPFGHTSSPRVFTKILVPVVRYVHSQGHRLNPYIDDLLGASATYPDAQAGGHLIVHTLLALGFLINMTKSKLEPSQDLVHLGARIQTLLGIVSVPREKAVKIMGHAQTLLTKSHVQAREFLSFIGSLTACQEMVQWCMYHIRPLSQFLAHHYVPHRDSLSKLIPLDKSLQECLTFWSNLNHVTQGRRFLWPDRIHVITTDSSQEAYGAWFQDQTLSGRWVGTWQQAHINLKEMQVVLLALQAFHEMITPGHVLIQSDNATVVAYLCHQGGMHSHSLDRITRRIVRWCQTKEVTLSAVHVAGADNCLADALSRPGQLLTQDKFRSVEWELSQKVANQIFQRWGIPRVDLFATRLNRKVPVFCSRLPDPMALQGDPLMLSWSQGLLYLFPPLSLVLQSLAKIRREEAEAIAIIPWWPARGWFPLLLEMVVDLPILLPLSPMLLQGPEGDPHPSLQSLHLAAWRLSGKLYRQKEFQQLLQIPSPVSSVPAPKIYTLENGESLFAGARNKISIPFTVL